jgi:predicted phosphodiesterase
VAEQLAAEDPSLPSVRTLRRLVKIELHDAWEQALSEPQPEPDVALVQENARLAAQVQKATDTNRIERAAWRTQAQAFNVIESLQTEILGVLRQYGDQLTGTQRYSDSYEECNPVAVLHLSDLHFNELIDLPYNKYDFEVAAKRLELLAQKVKIYAAGCQRLVIALGGDIINSDRRLDEVLSMSTNRARAVVLATHLLRQLVLDLRSDFYIDLFGITGNEGRAKQELAWGDPAVSDSYDASVYWMLEALLGSDDRGLRVHPLQGNEVLFQIHDQTFLLIHGHQINASDQRRVQSLVGKHSAVAGQRVSHVLCGHIHATLISDYISRNASMAGANAYSDEGLNFASKAAQNLHIVSQRGLDGIKLDLQDYQEVQGYQIIPQLEAHCAQSLDKARRAALNKPQVRIVV